MKRLIICSDGLWTSPSIPADSNLGLLSTALSATARNGEAQMLVVDPFQGLAAQSAQHGGYLNDSLHYLYRCLALNYEDGDEIWLFGFSRGSFIVRSLAGMLRNVGLLRKSSLVELAEAWHIYRTRWGVDAQNAERFRRAHSRPVEIRFLGVFDTLSKAGVPEHCQARANPPVFHNTTLSSTVQFAYHALAIDERREGYEPCLWRTGNDRSRTEQCWFTGDHRDIGGIQGDTSLAILSLHWMCSRATALGLALDERSLSDAMSARERKPRSSSPNTTFRRSGKTYRPIGQTNPDETLHPSAEQRFLRQQGYRPANLRAYMGRDEQIQLPL